MATPGVTGEKGTVVNGDVETDAELSPLPILCTISRARCSTSSTVRAGMTRISVLTVALVPGATGWRGSFDGLGGRGVPGGGPLRWG
jgi:hypothetical protein